MAFFVFLFHALRMSSAKRTCNITTGLHYKEGGGKSVTVTEISSGIVPYMVLTGQIR